jgi:lactoylglutathione lyase
VITHIGNISVFVTDQNRAVDFYVNELGFEKRSDQAMGPDAPRWIEVAPAGAQTSLVMVVGQFEGGRIARKPFEQSGRHA